MKPPQLRNHRGSEVFPSESELMSRSMTGNQRNKSGYCLPYLQSAKFKTPNSLAHYLCIVYSIKKRSMFNIHKFKELHLLHPDERTTFPSSRIVPLEN
ncbi:hypothetical protein Ocin01_14675 [Orchesella cincta]|uniref:Uncharacterized protein n=1 Tax=Orchesella cincta TaxID=48709 RepID=A0A1D2MGA0_ORCCI|nr:hypothetical protein Ocin01_14675 [Orchesella cincta]